MALVLLRLHVMDLLLVIAAQVQGGVGLLQRKCFPLALSPLGASPWSWKLLPKKTKMITILSALRLRHHWASLTVTSDTVERDANLLLEIAHQPVVPHQQSSQLHQQKQLLAQLK